ncbi:hypothetical protein EV368DRAFT_86086 [Lentinula lateritia]|nr:hypothetical protein EV368DRAFT_86086 [Lentinula lateritia]
MSIALTDNDLIRNRRKNDNPSTAGITYLSPTSPEILNDAPHLTKLYSVLNELTFSDGLCGANLPRTKEFVTSPNCTYIPEPPLGSTRDLYRRRDARYGPDDPISWPQPFNPRYPFFAAVTKKPTGVVPFEDFVMWMNLQEQDMGFTEQGRERKEGVVTKRVLEPIENKITLLRQRTRVFLTEASISSSEHFLIQENNDTIDLCLTRLRGISSTLRVLQCGLSELQRAWLTIEAILDFHRDVRKRNDMNTSGPAFVQHTKMGSFVWDDKDARMLFLAGLPVFFIRPWSAFDRQIITTVVSLKKPLPPLVEVAPADPPYPPLVTTQAGSDIKFSVIRSATANCFKTVSPFQNMHLPGAYASSYELARGRIMAPAESPTSTIAIAQSTPANAQGTHRSRHQVPKRGGRNRKLATNPPKSQRDIFADLPNDDPRVPPAIPGWYNVNKTIRQEGIKAQKKLLPAPDPGLFFGLEDKTHQSPYFYTWEHIRPAWLAMLQAGKSPQTVDVWCKVLAYTFIKPLEEGVVITPKTQVALDAKNLVEQSIKSYDTRMSYRPRTVEGDFDITRSRQLIRELCMVNFRSELLYVDDLLDQSRPQPSPSLSVAELEAATANHKRSRRTLISHTLLFDSLTPHASVDLGLAAVSWSERYAALKHFWTLMDTWPREKPVIWRRGIEMDLTKLASIGVEWERILAQFYVQSAFDILGRPPSLPRRL